MDTTEFPYVKLYRSNSFNMAIAQSPTGAGAPVNEIVAPLVKTGTIAVSGVAVTGIGTNFVNECKTGDYMFVNNAALTIIGEIGIILNATSIVLKNASSIIDTGLEYKSCSPYGISAKSKVLIFVPRIDISATEFQLVSPRGLRVGETETTSAYGNTDYIQADRVSPIGKPDEDAATSEIPYTIRRQGAYQTSGATIAFPTAASRPIGFWGEIDFYGATDTELPEQSRIRIIARSVLPYFQTQINGAYSDVYNGNL